MNYISRDVNTNVNTSVLGMYANFSKDVEVAPLSHLSMRVERAQEIVKNDLAPTLQLLKILSHAYNLLLTQTSKEPSFKLQGLYLVSMYAVFLC